MSTTLDRLRRLQKLHPKKAKKEFNSDAHVEELVYTDLPTTDDQVIGPVVSEPANEPDNEPVSEPVSEPASEPVSEPAPLEALIAGEIITNAAGTCYVRTEQWPLNHHLGTAPLARLHDHAPKLFAPFHPNFNLTDHHVFDKAAFIDTETTGLGGGASIYPFMVGVGVFEDDHFIVRQFFMRNPAEEGALLLAVAELLQHCTMTITFNGRTFDLPLLRNRVRFNRMTFASGQGKTTTDTIPLLDTDQAHLDLLMPARRLWRRRLQSCRLVNLETHILAQNRTHEDVPGYMIPQLYIDYVQSGDAREMQRVFYHNALDIVTMVGLATQLSHAFSLEPGTRTHPPDLLDALDWWSLGHSYEQVGDWHHAEAAYQHALTEIQRPSLRAQLYERIGLMQKRQERWTEATTTWQEWLTSIAGHNPTPFVELAKYCEWQTKDLAQAEMWAGWALHNLNRLPMGERLTYRVQIEALEHRLKRIKQKSVLVK
ncbi:MAG: ribonuclease H-like domain-containing protein [Chloroflexota bacterium]